MQPKSYSLLIKKLDRIWIFVLIALVIWVARYWHISSFGLYEDDFTIIPRAVEMNATQLFKYVYSYIVHLYGHARPLSDSFIYIFSHLGWKLGGMQGAYWIGYLIFTLNSILFFLLLKRIGDQTFAVTGVLAYVLFSADTTQVFLTHSLGLQPSITLLLLACHLYLSDKRWLAYLVVPIILFSYETPFPVFMAIPLLKKRWQKSLVKEMGWHVLILGGMLGGVFLLRSVVGEGRVAGLGFPQVIVTPITHMMIGPVVSLGTYLYRPLQALKALNSEILITIILGWLVFAWVISRLKVETTINLSACVDLIKRREFSSPSFNEFKDLIRLAFVGFIMLVLAYPLTFTIRAYAISGRDTRVHFAAVLGASIVCACGCSMILYLANILRKKVIGTLLLAGFFATLMSYGFVIQRDYRVSWEYQQEFWSEVIQLVPDVEENTIILVPPEGFRDTRQIGANTWNLPRIFDQIYHFPAEWKNPPRVYRLIPGWQSHITTNTGSFRLDVSTTIAPPSLYQIVEPSHVIWLEPGIGHLTRRTTPIPLNGKEFALKATSAPVLNMLDKGFLYNYLIQMP